MLKRLATAAFILALSCAGALAQTVATTTNSSAAIVTGNTFQSVLSAVTNNTQRRSLTIQNNNTTDNCWLFVGAGSPTKANSMLLLPGGAYARYFPYVPSDPIQATCVTAGDTIYVENQ